MTKRRNLFVALILTFLGYVGFPYLGRPKRFAFYAILTFILLLVFDFGFVSNPDMIKAVSAANFLLVLWVLFDAFRIWRKQRELELKSYNKWWSMS